MPETSPLGTEARKLQTSQLLRERICLSRYSCTDISILLLPQLLYGEREKESEIYATSEREREIGASLPLKIRRNLRIGETFSKSNCLILPCDELV
jgi:hypothetical protein